MLMLMGLRCSNRPHNKSRKALEQLSDVLSVAINESPKRSIELEYLWTVTFGIDPDLATTADRRQRMRNAIDEVASAGIARLPSITSRHLWDNNGIPALPLRIYRVRAEIGAASKRAEVPTDLRPELAGALSMQGLSESEIRVLRAVNVYLRDRSASPVVAPERERSLQVFGDEKALESLTRRRLFTSGVLSHALLDCYKVHPPFVYQKLNDSRVALVVENHHTYHSALLALNEDARGIGVVIYGAGDAFIRSVTYLADLDPVPEVVWYFGDLDQKGLRIPQAAAGVAADDGLATPTPAVPLYRAMLESGLATPARRVDLATLDNDLSWLPKELRSAASAVIIEQRRIPQESVGIDWLRSHKTWW